MNHSMPRYGVRLNFFISYPVLLQKQTIGH